jgi:hypothetical protein
MDEDSDHLSSGFKTVFKKNEFSSLTRSKKKLKVQVIKESFGFAEV